LLMLRILRSSCAMKSCSRRKAAAKLEAAQQALSRFPRVRRDKRTRWPPAGRTEGRQAARQGTPPATRPRTQDRAYAGAVAGVGDESAA
jgi:hypothetical protein